MPIYEYVCDNCRHEMEAFQKLSEEPLRTCPQCNTESLRKKVSAAGFRLKGGGWYETDFKSGKKKNVAGDKSTGDDKSSASESASKSGDSSGSGDKSASSGSSGSTSSAGSSSGDA